MIFSFSFVYYVVNIVYFVVHIVCEVDVIANSLVLYLQFCSTLITFSSSSSSSSSSSCIIGDNNLSVKMTVKFYQTVVYKT